MEAEAPKEGQCIDFESLPTCTVALVPFQWIDAAAVGREHLRFRALDQGWNLRELHKTGW